jgi:RimJ/RimL family protein N-acetyltransferase
MLSYRNLSQNDRHFIFKHWVGKSNIFAPNLTENELHDTIQKMNTKRYNGQYYEIFGILNDNTLVGTFSFYQRESDTLDNAVYLGIEISEENRKKGYATETVFFAFTLAKEKGFTKIYSQARINNYASVNLHNKCGFEIISENQSKSGYAVYDYVYVL